MKIAYICRIIEVSRLIMTGAKSNSWNNVKENLHGYIVFRVRLALIGKALNCFKASNLCAGGQGSQTGIIIFLKSVGKLVGADIFVNAV